MDGALNEPVLHLAIVVKEVIVEKWEGVPPPVQDRGYTVRIIKRQKVCGISHCEVYLIIM